MGGALKDAKSWAKFWADKKYYLKKIIAQRNASASRTGGGIESLPTLTDLEERHVSVMGGSSFAEGDQQLSVPLIIPVEPEGSIPQSSVVTEVLDLDNPMPSTSQAMTSPINQPTAPSTQKRSPSTRRLRQKQQSQLQTERQRLIRIEEKRVEAEVAHADGWKNLVQSIDNLANAIRIGAEKIAQALQNSGH